ncbi:MAG: 23S rRNA (adenine(2503)-C(2))-methyltransferase RlmN [Gammaproteobacteria bacterium]|nr:MAG: 23S rRNA (adenine(2503)-C(2))-methyltransferase RlmN [Gammaproteobacteria bacterium]
MTSPRTVPETTSKRNLFGLSRPQLGQFFADLGEKPFRASQVIQWIHRHGVTRFDDMTNLGKGLRERLKETACITPPKVLTRQHSQDGTRKWLIQVGPENQGIETVYIPTKNRGTLCVSSQVGCALDCQFCSTAQLGFSRNLGSDEIIAQLWLAWKELGLNVADFHGKKAISNIVLMGMGEPLLNLDNVISAVSIMQDDLAYGLAKKRITLSTAGHVPGIYRLRELSDISLAVSLHAPNDQIRNQIMPINRKYPVEELLDACQAFISGQKQRHVTFEYVMLDGINDSDECAHELVKRLSGMASKVNLIPFNPFPGTRFKCSPEHRIQSFQRILMSRNIMTMTRRTRGDDIDAACGQLVGKHTGRRNHRHVRTAPEATVL